MVPVVQRWPAVPSGAVRRTGGDVRIAGAVPTLPIVRIDPILPILRVATVVTYHFSGRFNPARQPRGFCNNADQRGERMQRAGDGGRRATAAGGRWSSTRRRWSSTRVVQRGLFIVHGLFTGCSPRVDQSFSLQLSSNCRAIASCSRCSRVGTPFWPILSLSAAHTI